jgi:hypothetical protein
MSESTKTPGKFAGRYRKVGTNEVIVPTDKYQRVPTRVGSLVSSWNWTDYDAIKVYEIDGHYEVFDGGHRVEAAKKLYIDELPAMVYPIDDKQAAASFSRQNHNRRNITKFHVHEAALYHQDPVAMRIEEILDEEDFSFTSTNNGSGTKIQAVASIYSIFENTRYDGDQILRDTLRFAKRIWPSDPKLADGAFLFGLAEFLNGYQNRITEEHEKNLRQIPINRLLEEAAGFQQSTRARRVAASLRKFAGLRKRKRYAF